MVAANLPYAVGSAVLRHLLEPARRPPPPGASCSRRRSPSGWSPSRPTMTVLGVATQFYAEPRIAFRVPPSVFLPPPNVESAVVLLDVRARAAAAGERARPLLPDRQRRLPPQAEAGRQLPRRRARPAQGRRHRLARPRRHRPDAPRPNPRRRRMGHPDPRRPTVDESSMPMRPCGDSPLRIGRRVDAAIALLAPAKLNLGLEVTGRRADGYHDTRHDLPSGLRSSIG